MADDMHFKNAHGDKPHDVLFRTEIGQAIFPHILTPDTRFDEAGKFKAGILLEEDETRTAREAMTAIFRKAMPDHQGEPHLPFKVDEGRTYLLAKSTYRPKMWNSERRVIEEPYLVRSGHRIRVIGRLRPFRSPMAQGLACYLTGVEVHEPLDRLEIYRTSKPDGILTASKPAIQEIQTTRPPAFDDDDFPF